jgi:hypothetical protein
VYFLQAFERCVQEADSSKPSLLLPFDYTLARRKRSFRKRDTDFLNAALGERAECLDSHAAFADVKNYALRYPAMRLRDQVNNTQLAHRKLVAPILTPFSAGMQHAHHNFRPPNL